MPSNFILLNKISSDFEQKDYIFKTGDPDIRTEWIINKYLRVYTNPSNPEYIGLLYPYDARFTGSEYKVEGEIALPSFWKASKKIVLKIYNKSGPDSKSLKISIGNTLKEVDLRKTAENEVTIYTSDFKDFENPTLKITAFYKDNPGYFLNRFYIREIYLAFH